MKTPERFDRALKALVQAFFNDTLAKGWCSACAVGNMVQKSCGYYPSGTMYFRDNHIRINQTWGDVFMTTDDGSQNFNPRYYKDEPKKQIDSTGYSLKELMKVEFAFETSTRINGNDYDQHTKSEIMKDQFNGLMAVVDVLCEIEGLDATPYKEAFEYKEDFTPVHIS